MNSFKDKHSNSNHRVRAPHAPQHQQQQASKNKNHVFDSQGPTGKARGTSAQLVDKYVSLGREASAMGDSVMCEYFFQYAEHYRRVTQEFNCRAKQSERVETHLVEHAPVEGAERAQQEKPEKQERHGQHLSTPEEGVSGHSSATEAKHPRNYRKKQTRPVDNKEVPSPVITGAILSAPGYNSAPKEIL